MNRREFLKKLGIGAGAVVVAPLVVSETPKTEPPPGKSFSLEDYYRDVNNFGGTVSSYGEYGGSALSFRKKYPQTIGSAY